jgi:hypothetical protein
MKFRCLATQNAIYKVYSLKTKIHMFPKSQKSQPKNSNLSKNQLAQKSIISRPADGQSVWEIECAFCIKRAKTAVLCEENMVVQQPATHLSKPANLLLLNIFGKDV